MFITPHTSVALWISTKVTDPVLAFAFGVLSHIIMDMIPHGDEAIDEYSKTLKGKVRFFYRMKIASADAIIAGGLILFFVFYGQPVNHWVLFWATFGAWLPDVLWIVTEIFKINALYWYDVYHVKLHNLFGWKYSVVYGIPFQILFTFLFVRLVF